MNSEALTALCHDLPKAFDFDAQPQPQFWYDFLARLKSYKAQAMGNSLTHAHPRIDAVPQIVLSENPNRCEARLRVMVESFAWDSTCEGFGSWSRVWREIERVQRDAEYHTSNPRLHRQRKVKTPVSYADERDFFEEYKLTPAFFRETIDSYIAGHFPHHDPEDPTMLRYFPQTKPFHLDFAIRTKPGRFLESFYRNVLSKPEIASMAAKFRVAGLPPKLIIGTSADDFDHAYRNGPSSCMSQGKATFEGMYPPRSYAGGDLAVGYLEKYPGKVSARVILFPERKIASRIYGDSEAMRKSLASDGYRICYDTGNESDYRAFDGATMIPQVAHDYEPMEPSYSNEKVLVLPYGDHAQRGVFDKESGRLTWYREARPEAKHNFSGGFSLYAFPKDPSKLADPAHPDGRYVRYYSGGSTGTASSLIRASEYRDLGYLDRVRAQWSHRQATGEGVGTDS